MRMVGKGSAKNGEGRGGGRVIRYEARAGQDNANTGRRANRQAGRRSDGQCNITDNTQTVRTKDSAQSSIFHFSFSFFIQSCFLFQHKKFSAFRHKSKTLCK
jgi:hypothetical protein